MLLFEQMNSGWCIRTCNNTCRKNNIAGGACKFLTSAVVNAHCFLQRRRCHVNTYNFQYWGPRPQLLSTEPADWLTDRTAKTRSHHLQRAATAAAAGVGRSGPPPSVLYFILFLSHTSETLSPQSTSIPTHFPARPRRRAWPDFSLLRFKRPSVSVGPPLHH